MDHVQGAPQVVSNNIRVTTNTSCCSPEEVKASEMICILCGYMEIRLAFLKKQGFAAVAHQLLCFVNEQLTRINEGCSLLSTQSRSTPLVFNFFMAQLNGPLKEKAHVTALSCGVRD